MSAILKTRRMQMLEMAHGRDIRDILRDAYAEHGNVIDAARALGITNGAFSVWVRDLGGTIRSEVAFPADEPARATA